LWVFHDSLFLSFIGGVLNEFYKRTDLAMHIWRLDPGDRGGRSQGFCSTPLLSRSYNDTEDVANSFYLFTIFVDGDYYRVRSGSSEEFVNGNTSLL